MLIAEPFMFAPESLLITSATELDANKVFAFVERYAFEPKLNVRCLPMTSIVPLPEIAYEIV